MKTITIKLPEEEVRELEGFVKKKKHLSKSEFIRHLIMEKLESYKKEKYGWLAIAQKSLDKLWDNKMDEKVWNRYIQ